MTLWQHVLIDLLTLTLISFILETLSTIITIKAWNRCPTSESKIESFIGVSVQTCSQNCDVTLDCFSYNYFPRGKFCEMLTNDKWLVGGHAIQQPCLHGGRSTEQSKHVRFATYGDCRVKACKRAVVANANVLGNIHTVGSRIKVECHVGYRLENDTLPILCGEDGIWTHISNCSATCPEPSSVPNANVSTGDNTIGELRTYSCYTDRALRPENGAVTTTECLYNNTWTPTNFQCLKDCGEPGNVHNAVIGPGDTTEAAERYYKCNEGFGTPMNTTYLSIVCQSNGTWGPPPSGCEHQSNQNGATSFVFGFIKQHSDRNIYIVASHPAQIIYSVPLKNISDEIIFTNGTGLAHGFDLQQHLETGYYPYGLFLQSKTSVEVYIESGTSPYSDGTVVIPEKYLSTSYMLLLWSDRYYIEYKSEFAVVGTVDDTDMKITFPNGSWVNLNINRYQLYYYQTTLELTGTIISSSENIAVFAGQDNTIVFEDRLFEQMPPISSLQTDFIVSYPYPRYDYAVRIAAVEDNTEIELSNGASHTLDCTEYSQHYFNNEPISISASRRVLVAVFSNKLRNEYEWGNVFDGSMLIVPGLSQFKSEYNIFVPRSVVKCVLMVTYPTYLSSVQNIRLNHGPFLANSRVEVTVKQRGTYTVLYTELSKGFSVIYTTDGTPFGAYLSFFRSYTESWFSLPYRF